jgi:hypothetical protein
MGMVSFLSSPVVFTFWSKKVRKKYAQKVAHFSMFFGQKFGGKNGRKTTNFTCQTDLALISTIVIRLGCNFK